MPILVRLYWGIYMAITLQLDQHIDGVPPGSQATQFGSAQMMDNMNSWLVENSGILGLEAAQNKMMHSIVKGLDISGPNAMALTVPSFGIGQVGDDGRALGNAATVSVQAAQDMAQNMIKQGPTA